MCDLDRRSELSAALPGPVCTTDCGDFAPITRTVSAHAHSCLSIRKEPSGCLVDG